MRGSERGVPVDSRPHCRQRPSIGSAHRPGGKPGSRVVSPLPARPAQRPSAPWTATPREPTGLCLRRAGSCGLRAGCSLTREGWEERGRFQEQADNNGATIASEITYQALATFQVFSTHKPSEASTTVFSHTLFWNLPTAPSQNRFSFPSPRLGAGW